MLILASAALPEIRTERLQAVARRLDQTHQTRALGVFARSGTLRLDHFPGQYERREHHLAIHAAEPLFPAINQFLDFQFRLASPVEFRLPTRLVHPADR